MHLIEDPNVQGCLGGTLSSGKKNIRKWSKHTKASILHTGFAEYMTSTISWRRTNVHRGDRCVLECEGIRTLSSAAPAKYHPEAKLRPRW